VGEGDASETEKKTPRFQIAVSEETTEKIADVLIDTFKPLQHGLGMAGDWVESKRREAQAIRTLKAAQKIAAEDGKAIEQPSPKFLIPYLNSASLEDEADEDIKAKWANLLVNAGSKPDSFSCFASSVLATISAEEVNLLNAIVEASDALRYPSVSRFNVRCGEKWKIVLAEVEGVCRRTNAGEIQSAHDVAIALNEIEIANPSVTVLSYNFETKNEAIAREFGGKDLSFHHSEIAPRYSVFQMLQARNILEEFHRNSEFGIDAFVTLTLIDLTNLGFELVRKIYRAPKSEDVAG